jgi:hypothetical protein
MTTSGFRFYHFPPPSTSKKQKTKIETFQKENFNESPPPLSVSPPPALKADAEMC